MRTRMIEVQKATRKADALMDGMVKIKAITNMSQLEKEQFAEERGIRFIEADINAYIIGLISVIADKSLERAERS